MIRLKQGCFAVRSPRPVAAVLGSARIGSAWQRGPTRRRDQVTDRTEQLRDRMAMQVGPKRRKDPNPRPLRSKAKPVGYVFGRPSSYLPEYCERQSPT